MGVAYWGEHCGLEDPPLYIHLQNKLPGKEAVPPAAAVFSTVINCSMGKEPTSIPLHRPTSLRKMRGSRVKSSMCGKDSGP